jgi:SAM-dependent methyltransferase
MGCATFWRPANPNSVSDIFSRSGFAHAYEIILKLPVIRSIRAQEQRLIRHILDENLSPADEVLEIGAGTGFYSFEIARRCRQLMALERAPGMTRILQRRIASADIRNMRLVECDFLAYWRETGFDVVVAIGVLDGIIEDWQPFLDRCVSLAKRTVIVTVPQFSLWSRLYWVFSKMSRSPARIYKPEELMNHLNGYRVRFHETGLRTRFTHGMTLVVVIEKNA